MRVLRGGLVSVWVWLLLIAGMCVAVMAMAEEAPTQLASNAAPVPQRVSQHTEYRKIVINTTTRRLTLYTDGIAVASYSVGVGKPGFATPVGQYKVMRMLKNPGWENPYQKAQARTRIGPGNNNPLGTRWIGFLNDGKGEYGIHGTNVPSSVGKYSSHGCVRMYVKDAEELYSQIDMGVPVEVVR